MIPSEKKIRVVLARLVLSRLRVLRGSASSPLTSGKRSSWRKVRQWVLRISRDEDLLLPTHCHKEHRQLTVRHRIAFVDKSSGPKQVWQLDFTGFHAAGITYLDGDPGQNVSRERWFGTLRYERLHLDDILDVIGLAVRIQRYWFEHSSMRRHEHLS